VEFWGNDNAEVELQASKLIAALQAENLGYAYPILFGEDANKAWDIRKAGLGLIRNLPGDTQPVNLIEDCAVAVEDLPEYIAELEVLLKKSWLACFLLCACRSGRIARGAHDKFKDRAGKAAFQTSFGRYGSIGQKIQRIAFR